MSDSVDDGLDPVPASFFQQRDTSRRDEEMIPAAVLKAQRKKFWDDYNRMEEQKKKVETDAAAAEKIKTLAKEREDSDDAIRALKTVLIPSFDEITISMVHPGLQHLNTTDSHPSLDAENYVFELCKSCCNSGKPSRKNICRLSLEEFRDLILEDNTILLGTYTTEDLQVILKNLFVLMAISKDDEIIQACYGILYYFHDVSILNVQDVLDVAILWGISWEALDLSNDKTDSLFSGLNVNPTEYNVEKVLDYLCLKLHSASTLSDCESAGPVLRILFLTAVDTRFRYSTIQVKFRKCVYSVLEQISAAEWTDDDKITDLAFFLYFGDAHFHNQAFYCMTLLGGKTNNLSRCLHNYLATRLIRSMVGAGNEDELLQSECNLMSMLQLLNEQKIVIYKMRFYELYVLLCVVRSYVEQYDFSTNNQETLRRYIDWLNDVKANIRGAVTSPDFSEITSLIASVYVLWDALCPVHLLSINII